MAQKKKNKFLPVYIMIAIFILSFSLTVFLGKLLSNEESSEYAPAFSSQLDNTSAMANTSSQAVASQADTSSEADSSDTSSTQSTPVTSTAPESEQPAELTSILTSLNKSYSDLTGSQLVVVSSRSVYATISCWEKGEDGCFKKLESYDDGFIGYWGISSSASQNDKFTQSGLFPLGQGFGFDENGDTKLDYFQITDDSYWVTDKNSESYNTHVSSSSSSDWSSAVAMSDDAYKYGVVIEDTGDVAGVFLCCGSECTERDVALSEENMKKILKWLDKSASPQILIY